MFIVVNILVTHYRHSDETHVQYRATCASRKECLAFIKDTEEKWRERERSGERISRFEPRPNLHIVEVPQ